MSFSLLSQSTTAGDLAKPGTDCAKIQGRPFVGDKEVGVEWIGENLISLLPVALQRLNGRFVDRHKTGLAELRVPNQ
jgi:hypothetical protein